MTKNLQQAPPPGLGMGDIAYVLFKHKWKIILVSLLGAAVAAGYYFSAPKLYVSTAKLMVRYVVERSAVDQVQNTLSVGQGGESIIQSEREILTSWDLAEKVASMPGMDEVVPKSMRPATPGATARVIAAGLTVSAGKGTNVLMVAFQHEDPRLARMVLDQLIQQYFIKHLEIHRSKEAAKFVTEKVEKSRTKLRAAEDELTKLKAESGIVSLPEAMATVNTEGIKAQSELNAAQAQLVEQRAKVAALAQFENSEEEIRPATEARTEAKVDSGPPLEKAAHSEATDSARATSPVAQRDLARPDGGYVNAVSGLKLLEAERMQMLKIYREEHEAVKDIDAKIARQQTAIEIYKQQSLEQSARRFREEMLAERAQLSAMEARVEQLKANVAAIQKNAAMLTTIIPKIADKELSRDIEVGNYKYMSASLEKAQVDEALDPSKMPNISIVQGATPASLDGNHRTKIALGVAGGTFGGIIALTLLFGLILHRTINRPQELENRLGIPLLLSIPFYTKNDLKRLLQPKGANGSNALNRGDRLRLSHPKTTANGSGAPEPKEPLAKPQPPTAPWEAGHFIRPYSESVRDRLGLYFDVKGITHKPKLIGVTGFSQGAGTSTLAAGLAAALSETGEGKVLMVDMTANGSEGEVHPFFAGRPAIPLDDALKPAGQKESTAENLYLATAEPNSAGSGSLGLNKFRRIMRDLQASDFDYMVFDMPALGQTSSTAAMAGLMDQVLVIVEGEASSPEEIERGFRDLVDARAKVSVVFNKSRSHGPKALVGRV